MVKRARFSFGDDDHFRPPIIRDSFDDLDDLAFLDQRPRKAEAGSPAGKADAPMDHASDHRQQTQDKWPTDAGRQEGREKRGQGPGTRG
jgi:hypothetical protein